MLLSIEITLHVELTYFLLHFDVCIDMHLFYFSKLLNLRRINCNLSLVKFN